MGRGPKRFARYSGPGGIYADRVYPVEAGAQVGAIQTSGDGSTQVAHVVVNKTEAIQAWVGHVREWVSTDLDPEERGRVLTRLDDMKRNWQARLH